MEVHPGPRSIPTISSCLHVSFVWYEDFTTRFKHTHKLVHTPEKHSWLPNRAAYPEHDIKSQRRHQKDTCKRMQTHNAFTAHKNCYPEGSHIFLKLNHPSHLISCRPMSITERRGRQADRHGRLPIHQLCENTSIELGMLRPILKWYLAVGA